MSTATRAKSEKSARDAQSMQAERADAPDVNISATPPPTDPAPVGPDLQAALNETPKPAPDPQAGRSGDSATIELERQCERLAETIRRHNGDMLGFVVERGDIVAEIINTALRKARNEATRKNLRAAALRQAELAALNAYDSETESRPDPDRWHRIARLCRLFPSARNLPSVAVADRFTVLITRIDPPSSWDEAERWEVKGQYAPADIEATIGAAVAEGKSFTKDDAVAALDRLNGARPEPPKPKGKDDPVKAARGLAQRIVAAINEAKINPETLFDELQSQLTRYGWAIVKGRAANGVETLKPVKVGHGDNPTVKFATGTAGK